MASHFIRGYIDGDGFIGTKIPQIGVLGTKEMLIWIKQNIKQNCNVGNPSILKKSNIYNLVFSGALQIPKILNWIYKDAIKNIRLDRKYKIAVGWANREKIII